MLSYVIDIACSGFGMTVLKSLVNGSICRGYLFCPLKSEEDCERWDIKENIRPL
jgi:hypothetical protein